MGHYYVLGRAVLPGVELDFHCKEMPRIAALGQQLNPEVYWHVDENCLERSYDLVMINGSLQYSQEWADLLPRLAGATTNYLFLTRLPVVEYGKGFVAIQHAYGTQMPHQQLNQPFNWLWSLY